MINKQKIIKELESLLEIKIDASMFPYVKGNSIRIGKYIVRSTKYGPYKIFDCEENRQIAEAFCKSSALALAKTLSKGKTVESKILKIDKEIQKWYNDCVFYKYTIKVTKDDLKRDITQTRYEIATAKTNDLKRQLETYIFG